MTDRAQKLRMISAHMNNASNETLETCWVKLRELEQSNASPEEIDKMKRKIDTMQKQIPAKKQSKDEEKDKKHDKHKKHDKNHQKHL